MKKTALKPIDISRVRELLNYNPITGDLVWKQRTSHRVKVGDVAGYKAATGYLLIGIDGKRRLAHHLAWVLATGEQPSGDVDHINRDRSDNRIANLRCVARTENLLNAEHLNATGHKGVMRMPSGRFRAAIHIKRVCTYIGSFDTAEEAGAAYAERHIQLYGKMSRFHPEHPNRYSPSCPIDSVGAPGANGATLLPSPWTDGSHDEPFMPPQAGERSGRIDGPMKR